MDHLLEDSRDREDRLIEDYLFSSYNKPASKSTFGMDQQFACPIEDEDLFSLDALSESTPMQPPQQSPTNQSQHPPTTQQPTQPQAQSQAQLERLNFKKKLLEEARAMALTPKKLGTDFSQEGTIEITIEQSRLTSDTNSKFIFNKIFNRSNKANDLHGTPECNTKSWDDYKDSVRKMICAQKRKIWDSFQRPVDEFDDEEEIIEEPGAFDLEADETVAEGKEDDANDNGDVDADDNDDDHDDENDDLDIEDSDGDEIDEQDGDSDEVEEINEDENED